MMNKREINYSNQNLFKKVAAYRSFIKFNEENKKATI